MKTDLQQQFIQDMLTESHEGLDRYDAAILLIESQSAGPDTLNDVFRVVHTLKGTAGCLGFHHIEKIAHAGENLLDALRSRQLDATPSITGGLLKLSDALRQHLQTIESTGADAVLPHLSPLIIELHELRQNPHAGAAPSAPSPAPASPSPAAETSSESPAHHAPAPVAPPPAEQGWGLFDDPAPSTAIDPGLTPPAAPPPPPAATPTQPAAPGAATPITPPATVRVDIGLLDKLMNLVGELVLTRNQLTQLTQARALKTEVVNAVSQRLNLVTSELQEGVMKTRLQPIGNIWSKFPRIVRDIAHELGKQVRLETVGAETELDRTIIEAIRDPLTHIIRNSIDHGIESPDTRAAAGKPAEGRVLMRAFHEGGQVNIEIVDDGAGIDHARVRRKAIEKSLITAEEAARLSERELTNLIFLPGFSTAEKVTNVSGRGVGMDVVRTNIEKIGGSVDLHSSPGRGTTLKIKIPLTLAIVPALVIRSTGRRFAIPQVSLVELVRVDGESASKALEYVYGSPVFRLRGDLLPLVFLDQTLKLRASREGAPEVLNIVVLRAERQLFGLVVDEVCDTEEIVVKPLGPHLKGLNVFAGATIMGDGAVALILDTIGLAERAGVIGQDRHDTPVEKTVEHLDSAGERTALLLFSVAGRERVALPLSAAARLEEFPASRVERSAGRPSVQYRGGIMPLVHIDQALGVGRTDFSASRETHQVIVCQQGAQTVGLVVDHIHDIVEEVVSVESGTGAPGIAGSAVIQGRVTDLLDVPAILRAAGLEARRKAA